MKVDRAVLYSRGDFLAADTKSPYPSTGAKGTAVNTSSIRAACDADKKIYESSVPLTVILVEINKNIANIIISLEIKRFNVTLL